MSAALNATSTREARHLLITGKVQGVGYRWNMLHQATQLGIAGWVRNRHEGSVEALVCGGDEPIAALIAWARQGPPGAQVSHVHVERAMVTDDIGERFIQQPTV